MAANIIWTPSTSPGNVGVYDWPPAYKAILGGCSGIARADINNGVGIYQILGAINGMYQQYHWGTWVAPDPYQPGAVVGSNLQYGYAGLVADMTPLKTAIDDLRSRKSMSAYQWTANFAAGKRATLRAVYELRDALPDYYNVRWPAHDGWTPWAGHYVNVPLSLIGIGCDDWASLGFNGSIYICTVAGTTADPKPAFPNSPGGMVTSGTATWTCYALQW
jgi:hypothetical protein